MPITYTLISSTTLSSAAASVTFSSIPNTYRDLVLKVSARLANAESPPFQIRFNGDTGANYGWNTLRAAYATTVSAAESSSSTLGTGITYAPGPTGTTTTFSVNEFYIPSYANTSILKPLGVHGSSEANNIATAEIANNLTAGLWNSTAAITSITLLNTNPYNWVSGSSFWLYGIKNS